MHFDYKINSGEGINETENSSKNAKNTEKIGEDTEVLHGISFLAREGSLTALVGESGSGKSTLAKLLVHFYDVTKGSIKIGGQDIRDMSIEALNQQISYVSQEQFLFHMSLLENIRLGKLDATDEEVMEADQICVLRDGDLAATGTHEQLLKICPEYQKLWEAAKGSARWKVSVAKEVRI